MLHWLKKKVAPKLSSMNTMWLSRDRLLHNISYLQSLKPDHVLFPVLKSNAYGHGLQQICRILNESDVPFLCVDSYPERQFVKKRTQKNVLILGETHPENYRLYSHERIHLAVYNITTLEALIAEKKRYTIHLFLNTGMNREGIQFHELDKALHLLQTYSDRLCLEGVMSHFANADELDFSFCKTQVYQFKRMYALIEEAGFSPKWRHIGNSAGMVRVDDPLFNAWRTGLSTYGYNPLSPQDPQYNLYTPLQPILRITSTVVSLQDVHEGDIVSYGGRFVADEKSKIATIPFGYHEGLNRKLTNNWQIQRKGFYLPLVGTVCMNLSCFDTLWHDVAIGDEVEIVGRDVTAPNSIQAFADAIGTISYEVLVNFDEKAKRTIL